VAVTNAMRKPFFLKGPHNILLVAGIVGCLFLLKVLFDQLYSEYDFKILAIELNCQQPLNNRCTYEYSVKRKDGSLSKIGLSGYMFRSEELVVGNSIAKNKFSFGYQVNGEKSTWGFWGITYGFYSLVFQH
jgi:hypothetical protein